MQLYLNNSTTIDGLWPNFKGDIVTDYSDTNLEPARKLAFQITSEFEGGKTDSLHLGGAGIISYGAHQATLSSSSLFKLIEFYTQASNSTASLELRAYLGALKMKDDALRYNTKFIDLLRQAAQDPIMRIVQDKFFSKKYWQPVVLIAEDLGIRSQIGLAVLYDTNIQGGLTSVLNTTQSVIGQSYVSEMLFLKTFLEQRRTYLYNIAALKRASGDFATAKLLELSAMHRIDKLLILLERLS